MVGHAVYQYLVGVGIGITIPFTSVGTCLTVELTQNLQLLSPSSLAKHTVLKYEIRPCALIQAFLRFLGSFGFRLPTGFDIIPIVFIRSHNHVGCFTEIIYNLQQIFDVFRYCKTPITPSMVRTESLCPSSGSKTIVLLPNFTST